MNKSLKISVCGAGAWGTTIANLLAEKGFKVLIFVREEKTFQDINIKKENTIYLKGIKLSKNLKATKNIYDLIDSDILINAIPTQYINNSLSPLKNKLKKKTIILSLSKGIEVKTGKRPSELLKEIFKKNINVLSGPNFAIEIANKKPAATTISGENKREREKLQKILVTNYFRVYENDDIIGTEIAGALKNVIAIASGIIDSLNLGFNTKAVLITRGLNEIRKFGNKLGAKYITFLGLSGVGDLILTCNSNISRNYSVGFRLGKGENIKKINLNMKQVAEGVKTSKAIFKLAKKLKVDMPISFEVYKVIYKSKDPKLALKNLMERKLKSEF